MKIKNFFKKHWSLKLKYGAVGLKNVSASRDQKQRVQGFSKIPEPFIMYVKNYACFIDDHS